MKPLIIVIVLLLLSTSAHADPFTDVRSSPLTSAMFDSWTKSSSTALGLPWYSVQPWEVDICTRGLSTSRGYSPNANNIIDFSLATPIYMDTITLLAKRTPSINDSYYELGWYVQPYQGDLKVKLTVYNSLNQNFTIATGTATTAAAFDGYKAFPIPCDTTIFGSSCVAVTGTLVRARLEWAVTQNGTDQAPQYLVSTFITSNATA